MYNPNVNPAITRLSQGIYVANPPSDNRTPYGTEPIQISREWLDALVTISRGQSSPNDADEGGGRMVGTPVVLWLNLRCNVSAISSDDESFGDEERMRLKVRYTIVTDINVMAGPNAIQPGDFITYGTQMLVLNTVENVGQRGTVFVMKAEFCY